MKMSGLKYTVKETLERHLRERQDELLAVSDATKDDRKPVVLDQAAIGRLSRMDAMQQQAMAIETERRREVELQRIEAALKRIKIDDYGYCVSCDEKISARRLKADPAEPLCIDCAEGLGRP